ncbi:MAG TPA: hypothetical protein VEW46_26235 [Pyrinomonadaceae bacterium]|nr:hypothetical protein [Pyrinomonadaceae bacterium]
MQIKRTGKLGNFVIFLERPHTPVVERPSRTAAASRSGTTMVDKRSQSASSGTLPVEHYDLHRRMSEVALREKVTSLEKVGKETRRRAIKASTPTSTGCKPKLAL